MNRTWRHSLTATLWIVVAQAAIGQVRDKPDDYSSVRGSSSTVGYVPRNPSIVPNEWLRWVAQAKEIIRTVSAERADEATASDIAYEAIRAGIDPTFILALAEYQSKFIDDSTSSSGGIGLLALSPAIHGQYGNPRNTLYQGKYNLRLGTSLLRVFLDQKSGDLKAAAELFLRDAIPAKDPSATELLDLYMSRRKQLQPATLSK
jgi:hypothetical protein